MAATLQCSAMRRLHWGIGIGRAALMDPRARRDDDIGDVPDASIPLSIPDLQFDLTPRHCRIILPALTGASHR
jgi:hypothetical protein